MTGDSDGWGAYVDALLRIEAPGGVVWVGPAPVTRTRGTYPDPEGRVICVITAHNPGGQTVSDEANAAEQERLERKLKERGWTWWRAAGGDPSWEHVEASAAVVGVEESEVVTLGAEFGQDAIFVLTPAGRSVVGCLSAREIVTGWSVSAEQPAEPAETVAQERPAVPVTPATAAETGHEDQDEDIEEEEEEEEDGVYESLSVCEENFLTGERAGSGAQGEAHDRVALVAKVYGEDFVFASPAAFDDDEYLDKHDEWLAATEDWTFGEIRHVLFQEAEDYHFLLGGWPIAGWCRCGEHQYAIESFLGEYDIRFDAEGNVRGQLEEEEDDDLPAECRHGSSVCADGQTARAGPVGAVGGDCGGIDITGRCRDGSRSGDRQPHLVDVVRCFPGLVNPLGSPGPCRSSGPLNDRG